MKNRWLRIAIAVCLASSEPAFAEATEDEASRLDAALDQALRADDREAQVAALRALLDAAATPAQRTRDDLRLLLAQALCDGEATRAEGESLLRALLAEPDGPDRFQQFAPNPLFLSPHGVWLLHEELRRCLPAGDADAKIAALRAHVAWARRHQDEPRVLEVQGALIEALLLEGRRAAARKAFADAVDVNDTTRTLDRLRAERQQALDAGEDTASVAEREDRWFSSMYLAMRRILSSMTTLGGFDGG